MAKYLIINNKKDHFFYEGTYDNILKDLFYLLMDYSTNCLGMDNTGTSQLFSVKRNVWAYNAQLLVDYYEENIATTSNPVSLTKTLINKQIDTFNGYVKRERLKINTIIEVSNEVYPNYTG